MGEKNNNILHNYVLILAGKLLCYPLVYMTTLDVEINADEITDNYKTL